ncbi:MAG: acetyl-CoA carboxylase carboxyl transferase subunit beta, partial [Calditrichaeota bacterium]
MDWFKRAKQGLIPQKKKEIPDLWVKCDSCGEIIYKRQLEQNSYVCASCGFHFRIQANDYIKLLMDEGSFSEFHQEITPTDFLKFKAKKKYADQLKDAAKKTQSADAIRTGFGRLDGHPVVFCVMDFSFIGGSMGSVVGEKIALAIDKAIEHKLPLIIVSASGGARMMEGALSLMQMAKTASRLTRLSEAGLPYISIMTDPTTGGVTASFAMLGDVNIGEP